MSKNKNSLIRLIAFYTDKFKELEKDSENSEKKELIYDTLKLLLELKEYRLKEYLKNIKEERLKKGEKNDRK